MKNKWKPRTFCEAIPYMCSNFKLIDATSALLHRTMYQVLEIKGYIRTRSSDPKNSRLPF